MKLHVSITFLDLQNAFGLNFRWTCGAADKYSVEMTGTAVGLPLISIFFCCGRCLVESDSEAKRCTLATQISGACD